RLLRQRKSLQAANRFLPLRKSLLVSAARNARALRVAGRRVSPPEYAPVFSTRRFLEPRRGFYVFMLALQRGPEPVLRPIAGRILLERPAERVFRFLRLALLQRGLAGRFKNP